MRTKSRSIEAFACASRTAASIAGACAASSYR
jgi:hypothetical protein